MNYLEDHTLYYKKSCPFCVKVLRFMEANDITMDKRDTLQPGNEQDLIRVGGKDQVACQKRRFDDDGAGGRGASSRKTPGHVSTHAPSRALVPRKLGKMGVRTVTWTQPRPPGPAASCGCLSCRRRSGRPPGTP